MGYNMGEISIEEIKDGDIIQTTVRGENGEEILAEGTVLKKTYIAALRSLNVKKIWIVDSNRMQVEEPKTKQDRSLQYTEIWTQKIQEVLEQHIYQGKNSLRPIEILAETMVREIDNVPKQYKALDTYSLYQYIVWVTVYCIRMAKREKMSEKQCKEVAIGALLHDIGLRYITVEWHNRDLDTMTLDEDLMYKQHTLLGYTALEQEKWVSQTVKNMVLFHHERLNGSGFPLHQKRFELACRIIQVVDYYGTHAAGIGCMPEEEDKILIDMKEMAPECLDEKLVRDFIEQINLCLPNHKA